MTKVLVTGGAGFIGSAVILHLVSNLGCQVLNVDKLTYAGNIKSLDGVSGNPSYQFERVDICDFEAMTLVFREFQPDKVMHLAAESHVDRSIDGPAEFIQSNIIGTYVLLEVSRQYMGQLSAERQAAFRFHHVSTDEVFGDLAGTSELFTEATPYAPSSPYSASKASSDHLVRAWNRTYNLPVVITNCSNNYGPRQFPEKLIPLIILNALNGVHLPIFGKGDQIRDWLHVNDHAIALACVLFRGRDSQTYNIGGYNEKTNLEVVKTVCAVLDELAPNKPRGIKKYEDLICFVKDRPGHDLRYAIDASKITESLGWKPSFTFETGIRQTVEWYINNEEWWSTLT